MSEPTIPNDDRQRRLEAAMAEYLGAADAGRRPEPESFLARHPELHAELSEFLADLSALAEAGPPGPGVAPDPMSSRPRSAVTTEGGISTTDPGAVVVIGSAAGVGTTIDPAATV